MFLETASLFSPHLAFHLIGHVMNMAIILFQIDLVDPPTCVFNKFAYLMYHVSCNIVLFCKFQQYKETDFMCFVIAIGFITYMWNIFVYCYFGKLATESFVGMADFLYNVSWHRLPVRLQKHLIIMIANMQRPVHYHGSHIGTMNLETFCKVNFLFTIITERTIYYISLSMVHSW